MKRQKTDRNMNIANHRKNAIQYKVDYVKRHNRHDRYDKKNLKYDFMPDLLEIIERPAHIGGKVIIWTCLAFLLAVLLWAALCKVDVVLTESGLVTIDGIVDVQSAESGVVSLVNVKNGDFVKEGDVLVVMCSDSVEMDVSSYAKEMSILDAENSIYHMILEGGDIDSVNIDGYDENVREYVRYIIMQEQYFRKSLEDIEDEERKENLQEQHNISIMGSILENSSNLDSLRSSKDKADRELEEYEIKANKSGYITGLNENLTGQIISSGTSLMAIVPDSGTAQIECYVSDRDIADIHVGMEAVIKLNAYPYSDYGTLKGTVYYVSASAMMNESGQSLYRIKVSVKNDREFNLMNGMTAGVEIKVRKRSILDYFLEPLKGAVENSVKDK